jgi:hypothetical protein
MDAHKELMMKKAKFYFNVISLLSIFSLTSYATAPSYSLILAEFGEDPDGDQTQTLVRYRFDAGELVSKQSLLTKKTDDLRFEFGSTIYQNRYVITTWGDVIDLDSNQVIFKSNGKMIHLEGNLVTINNSKIDEKGFFTFNLKSHEYARLEKSDFWIEPSFYCPYSEINANGQIRAMACNDGIWLLFKDGHKKRLPGQFSRVGTDYCSSFNHPSFLWIDNSHLLTQLKNGQLIRVDTEGKIEQVLTLPAFDPPACGPEFQRDKNNRIYYEIRNQAWLINVDKRSFEKYLWEAQGNGFDLEFQRNSAYGHRIRYQEKEIGNYWCDNPHTTTGHIALAFGAVGSNLGNPEGVMVWSSANNNWTQIKIDFLADIVGWVKN